MALPAAFLEELRARTPLAGVIGRRVRLARSGRQWKGCCPFHGEKTPSFYVYDDHFHCFGCGAHGDAIGFVMQSQGAGFMEAVEQLAAEAGLDVPKPTPEAAAAEKRRHDLHSVLDAAQARFRRLLFEPEGREGLAYLRRRGLSDETIERFGLGWSGAGRGGLAAELAAQDVPAELLRGSGLLRETEDGRTAELFFNRVMFPIRDRRGRTISFGGRTLGDAPPKYVNGPETDVFSKRRTLYALDQARDGVRSGGPLIVVEGYMDVIALHQAGFRGAVAPLGTALTAEQLEEAWRLDPAPLLCFDGDAAGARAAARAAETALPLLTPERTLRFARLPAGEDPDTLVRQGGPGAFQAQIEAALPLADALFGLLREAAPAETPEQRAAFRARLEALAKSITHPALASEYRHALLDRFFADRRGATRPAARPRPGLPPAAARPLRAPRAMPGEASALAERARVLTAILLRHPDLLRDVEHAYAELALPAPLDRLRHALTEWAQAAEALDSAGAITHLTEIGLAAEAAQALSAVPVPLPACAAPDAMPAEAEAGWWHIFGLMHRGRLQEEIAQAQRDFVERPDRTTEARLTALVRARDDLMLGEQQPEDTDA
ncbi:MAG: DNA primase [Proteobacteria bacterium]|nr:DNA primase [Pseudomonadota bacterium]